MRGLIAGKVAPLIESAGYFENLTPSGREGSCPTSILTRQTCFLHPRPRRPRPSSRLTSCSSRSLLLQPLGRNAAASKSRRIATSHFCQLSSNTCDSDPSSDLLPCFSLLAPRHRPRHRHRHRPYLDRDTGEENAMLDVTDFITERGGNPDKIRESQRRRHASVEIVDEIIALFEDHRGSKLSKPRQILPWNQN